MEDALRVMHTIIQFNILLRVLILVLIEDTLRGVRTNYISYPKGKS